MRWFLVGLVALVGVWEPVIAGDRRPVLVTCRPVVVATVHCVTIRGIDYELEPILMEYRTEWTWPGDSEQALRDHLRAEHQVTGIEALSFAQVRKLHAVLHEREKRKARASSGPPPVTVTTTVRSSGCPGGVCPAPQATRTRWFMWPRKTMWRQ